MTEFIERGLATNRMGAWLRQGLRPAISGIRGLPTWLDALTGNSSGPCVAFLPARGTAAREGQGNSGASYLRIGCMAQALEARGWRSVVIPWRLSLSQRRAILRHLSPDLVVMQGVRHELNRPDFYPGQRILLDLDDADFHLPHLEGPLRAAMPGIEGVIAGSRYVADWCRGAGAAHTRVVWTGTPPSTHRAPPHAARGPIVAWAQSRPDSYVREAEMVLRVMRDVSRRKPDARLRLYDIDPGRDDAFLAGFAAAGITIETVPNLGYSDYLASFEDVAVGLAPLCTKNPFSRGKSFGKILGYLDRDVPVLASDMADHALFFTQETGVITNDETSWSRAIVRLLGDADARQRMASAARATYLERLTTEAAAGLLSPWLRRIVESCRSGNA